MAALLFSMETKTSQRYTLQEVTRINKSSRRPCAGLGWLHPPDYESPILRMIVRCEQSTSSQTQRGRSCHCALPSCYRAEGSSQRPTRHPCIYLEEASIWRMCGRTTWCRFRIEHLRIHDNWIIDPVQKYLLVLILRLKGIEPPGSYPSPQRWRSKFDYGAGRVRNNSPFSAAFRWAERLKPIPLPIGLLISNMRIAVVLPETRRFQGCPESSQNSAATPNRMMEASRACRRS